MSHLQMVLLPTEHYVEKGETIVTHKGVFLHFNTKAFITDSIASKMQSNLYLKINQFWASKSAEWQDSLFDIYQTIHDILREEQDDTYRFSALREQVTLLIEMHPFEELLNWLIFTNNMRWPTVDLLEHYNYSKMSQYPRERTYLQQDYKELMAFTLQTRVLIPVWGMFLNRTDISARYRLTYALNLTSESNYSESPGYAKLRQFVMANLKSHGPATETGILELVSKEEYPEWIFSDLIIRKVSYLAFEPPTPDDRTAYAVRHLSSHIAERVNKSATTFRTAEDKKPQGEGEGGSEEDQRSNLESCPIRAALPSGDSNYMEYFLAFSKERFKQLAPQGDLATLQTFMNSINLTTFVPSDPQMLLLSWVMSPLISPRIFNDTSQLICNKCLAVAGAALWSWGHKELAVFATARYEDLSDSDLTVDPDGSRLNKALQDQLEQYWPYAKKRRSANDRTYKAVQEVNRRFSQNLREMTWTPTLPQEYLDDVRFYVTGTNISQRYAVPTNIRSLTYAMFFDIVERQSHTDPVIVADQIAQAKGLMAVN